MTQAENRAKLEASIKFNHIFGTFFFSTSLIFSLVLLFMLPLNPYVWMLILLFGLGLHFVVTSWREGWDADDEAGDSAATAGNPG